jgi:D-glycero-alpha-D-manno-heptose 1-phosphate guanylyltransferase
VIKEAIILAGGFGTRLQSVVSDLPKPMAPVGKQPFLNYQLRYLKHFGITKVILSVGHLYEKITSYYKKNFEGIDIDYSIEKTPLGTGGGIRLAMGKCITSNVLVLNGDSFFDIDINLFSEKHGGSGSDASLALRSVLNASRYGTVKLSESTSEPGRIIGFSEKSNLNQSGLINAGIYILKKEVYLNNSPAETPFSIEKDFFEKKLSELSISGFEFEGYFIDIGIPEDYTKAQDDFKEFKY